MQARPFLSLAGLGWFGDLRGGVAQRSNRLGRRFEYIEQCSSADLRSVVCSAGLQKRDEKKCGASVDRHTSFSQVTGAAIVWPRLWRHDLDKLPKRPHTAAGVVAEARAAAP